MGKIHSLDIVLLETSIFGVNQGYTGRYLAPRTAWVLAIFSVCYHMAVAYVTIGGQLFNVTGDLPINYISRMVFFYLTLGTTVVIQVRYLFRRLGMAPVGQKLSQLCQLSTWSGDISGCVARILMYIGLVHLHQFLPAYQKDLEGSRILMILFYWVNFLPTVVTEFHGQAMLIFQYELKELSKITEDVATRSNHGMEGLRALNRRHASLFALSNAVARLTGIDTLLIIETERLLILVTVFIQVNASETVSNDWGVLLFTCITYFYRIERITHHCFRGHRVLVEAERFVSSLDEFGPLDMECDEFFTELQIFRKQARLRKLQFDCNRFLKLDMKLIARISKNLLTLIIILVQLKDEPPFGPWTTANATEADNVTEYFVGFSEMEVNLSTVVNIY